MKKIKLFTSIFALLLVAIVIVAPVLSAPLPAKAQGFTPFGGFVVSMLPCTCSANFWLYMAPFFFPAPGSGALVYEPGSTIVYAHYVIPAVSVWLLGDYIPGVQACYFYTGNSCVPIPSFGLIRQTGTSL